MSARYVKPLSTDGVLAGVAGGTPQEILLSGSGSTVTWPFLSAANGSVSCGIWESAPFSKFKTHPDEMEFCYVIEGTVKLTDKAGNCSTFQAGDAFIVEPGFDGIWESVTAVRKYFVIAKCEPAA
ncbi:cupin domain-containing protein [Vogesella sp. LIG4]|uniref:cupin domain-containing protein n=1 Tax=Vogesella sp. LIG4 TaxID=1192162 RepID=UPI00081F9271|nr:cupin domain-containing protein [Vogesella sp. LIG4]SCK28082.1 hypothetical protein PSELUDRAFT_3427 [Vogesella sp. LIG4]